MGNKSFAYLPTMFLIPTLFKVHLIFEREMDLKKHLLFTTLLTTISKGEGVTAD